MKQFFCDCCGKQTSESDITTMNVNQYDVDLCYQCRGILVQEIEDASHRAEEEFMKTMRRQPLDFKYHCR